MHSYHIQHTFKAASDFYTLNQFVMKSSRDRFFVCCLVCFVGVLSSLLLASLTSLHAFLHLPDAFLQTPEKE